MNLWDFKSQKNWYPNIGFLDVPRYFDIGNRSDSYTTPSSAEKVIPKLTKPCVISWMNNIASTFFAIQSLTFLQSQ